MKSSRISLLLLLYLSSVHLLCAAEPIPYSPELTAVLAERHPRGVEDLRAIESQVQLVAAQVVPATVEVEVGHSIGSGVIVSQTGLVLTAAHVIGKPNRPATIVLADGRKLQGRTFGAHHFLDAGMVQIESPPDDLPFAPLVEEQSITIGQWVVATGQPGGILDDRSPPVRLGRVLAAGGNWLCTDCALVGGDSGGPLFNLHGEVVAIHMSIGPEVVHNFHVPLKKIRPFWDKMLTGEVWGEELADKYVDDRRPVLGLACRTEDNRAVVTQVFLGFPAEQAGIMPGDQIIAVDGQPITSIIELTKHLLVKSPGDSVHLEISRNARSLELDVVLSGIGEAMPGSYDPTTPQESELQEQP